MMHPLERRFANELGAIFRVSFALTLVLTVVLSRLDASLHTPAAPLGIISFELAGSSAAEMLASFSEAARRDALLLQGLDYLYLVSYSTAGASAAFWLGRRLTDTRPRFAAFARTVAWFETFAAVFDAIENVPLILMLRSGYADPTGATISELSAIAKFSLVAIGYAYLMVAGILVFVSRSRKS